MATKNVTNFYLISAVRVKIKRLGFICNERMISISTGNYSETIATLLSERIKIMKLLKIV